MKLIDADALKKAITEQVIHTTVDGHLAKNKAIQLIDNAPTVEPTFKPVAEVKIDKEQMQELVDKAKSEVLASVERQHGEWIDHENHIECNQCHVWFLKDHLIRKSFCPNCGADKRG